MRPPFQQSEEQLKVVIQKRGDKPLVLQQIEPRRFTIGTDVHSSYTITSPLFSKRHRLVHYRHGRNHLMIPLGVPCDLFSSDGETSLNSDVMLRLGLLERRNNCYAVPFTPGSKAIIKIGETAVGLEYAAFRPQSVSRGEELPWELRYSSLTFNDWIFGFIAALTLLLSFSIIWTIKGMNFPPHDLNQAIEKRYAKLILEVPMQTHDLFKPPVDKTREAAPEKKAEKKVATPGEKGPKPGPDNKKLAKMGFLGNLEKVSATDGVLQNRALKNAFQGVGVLTTKRPAGQRMGGPMIASRDSVNIDDMVAGIATSGEKGLGGGGGSKQTTRVSNPFDVSGSGAGHHLRSYAEIDRVIRQHLEGVRILYERYLRKNASLRGRVNIRFTIDSSGKVTQCAVVSSTLDEPEFLQQLVIRIKLWHFPAIESQAGGVTVEYPFTFLPKGTS